MGYGHLNIDEREVILKMLVQEASLREIARSLGRSAGTISRELTRNSDWTGQYKPHCAQRSYQDRRKASKEPYRLEKDRSLRDYVQARLKEYWSPEQISGRAPRAIRKHVSPVTIYSWIKRDKRRGGGLWTFLRQSHRRRRKRHGSIDRRGILPGRRMIDERPAVVNRRKRIGDWECDTMEGAKSSGLIATHVERKSRYTVAVKVKDKSAPTVTAAILEAMKKLPPDKIQTMTFDNGREFAGFKELEQGLGMQSYFAHPYHSWERGTNENTNGLLRQFFPKGMDFTQITEPELDRMLALLNNRPRKCLNYRTPTEVFWKKPKCCASD